MLFRSQLGIDAELYFSGKTLSLFKIRVIRIFRSIQARVVGKTVFDNFKIQVLKLTVGMLIPHVTEIPCSVAIFFRFVGSSFQYNLSAGNAKLFFYKVCRRFTPFLNSACAFGSVNLIIANTDNIALRQPKLRRIAVGISFDYSFAYSVG